MNNAVGMFGFAKEATAADPDFTARMEKEKLIEELTAIAKTRKSPGVSATTGNLRGSTADLDSANSESAAVEQEGSPAGFVAPGVFAATAGLMLALVQH